MAALTFECLRHEVRLLPTSLIGHCGENCSNWIGCAKTIPVRLSWSGGQKGKGGSDQPEMVKKALLGICNEGSKMSGQNFNPKSAKTSQICTLRAPKRLGVGPARPKFD